MTGGGGIADTDRRWMGAALALSARGRGRTAPNPNVGCVIVREGRVVGRGWTAPGGRPHAEAMAQGQAVVAPKSATVYVGLEPYAHESTRGPARANTRAHPQEHKTYKQSTNSATSDRVSL